MAKIALLNAVNKDKLIQDCYKVYHMLTLEEISILKVILQNKERNDKLCLRHIKKYFLEN